MEEDKFKKIIQKFALDEPQVSFTDKIMNNIGLQEEFVENQVLDKLLQNALLSNPKEDFTNNIMNQIIPQKQMAFQPIVSKKTWLIISGITAMIFIAVLLSQIFSKKTVNAQSKFNDLFELNNMIFIQMTQQSPIVFICLISICTLLVIDSFFRRRLNVSKFV